MKTLAALLVILAMVKPSVSVRVFPRFGFAPREVSITVETTGEAERFYCPEYNVDWGDGTHSMQESDCPPYEERTEYPGRRTFVHFYSGPGEYRIEVRLTRAGKQVARPSTVVKLFGGGA